MKSVLQAGWLLTNAVGNFIVLIVAEIAKLPKQVTKILNSVTKKKKNINMFFLKSLLTFSLFYFQVDRVYPFCLSLGGGVHHLLHYGKLLYLHRPHRNRGTVQE